MWGKRSALSHPASCSDGESIAKVPFITSMWMRQKCFLAFQLSHDSVSTIFLACLSVSNNRLSLLPVFPLVRS